MEGLWSVILGCSRKVWTILDEAWKIMCDVFPFTWNKSLNLFGWGRLRGEIRFQASPRGRLRSPPLRSATLRKGPNLNKLPRSAHWLLQPKKVIVWSLWGRHCEVVIVWWSRVSSSCRAPRLGDRRLTFTLTCFLQVKMKVEKAEFLTRPRFANRAWPSIKVHLPVVIRCSRFPESLKSDLFGSQISGISTCKKQVIEILTLTKHLPCRQSQFTETAKHCKLQ